MEGTANHTMSHSPAWHNDINLDGARLQKGGGKQRGPLPMTVAQILVLGIFGGIGYAATKEAQKTAQAVEVTAEYIEKGYNAVERYVAKYAGKPSETVAAAPRTPSGKDATEV